MMCQELLKVSENIWRRITSRELYFGKMENQSVKLKEMILDSNGIDNIVVRQSVGLIYLKLVERYNFENYKFNII